MSAYEKECAELAAQVLEDNRSTLIGQVLEERPALAEHLQSWTEAHRQELMVMLQDAIDGQREYWRDQLAMVLDDTIGEFLRGDDP